MSRPAVRVALRGALRPAGRSLAGLLAAATVLAGCASGTPAGVQATENSPEQVVVLDSAASFTARTISDWKSLGDAIVLVGITRSREDLTGRGDPSKNGGFYGRVVTVALERTFWQRSAAHPVPSSFSMQAWGWQEHGKYPQPIVVRGEPRLEVGHSYLLALARFPTGWAPLGDGAEMPFDDGIAGFGEWAGRDPGDPQPALNLLMGKNIVEAQKIIDAAQADPRASRYDDLPPLERAKKLGKAS